MKQPDRGRRARGRAAALGQGRVLLHRGRDAEHRRLAVQRADRSRPADLARDRAQPRRRARLHQGGGARRPLRAIPRRARHPARRGAAPPAAGEHARCRSRGRLLLPGVVRGGPRCVRARGRDAGTRTCGRRRRHLQRAARALPPRPQDARVLRGARRGRGRARRERDAPRSRRFASDGTAAGARAARVPLERARPLGDGRAATTRCSTADRPRRAPGPAARPSSYRLRETPHRRSRPARCRVGADHPACRAGREVATLSGSRLATRVGSKQVTSATLPGTSRPRSGMP